MDGSSAILVKLLKNLVGRVSFIERMIEISIRYCQLAISDGKILPFFYVEAH